MKKGIRHGDVCLIQAKKPTGLKKSDTKTLLAVGSGGNPHTFDNGTFYPMNGDDFIIGYLVSKNTKLFHAEHSPEGALIPNATWEVRRQSEYTPDGLRAVID